MKTSMMKALVITVAVLTLGLMSMSKVSGQPNDAAVVKEDASKAYQDAYKKAYDEAKRDQANALTDADTAAESSGGSCG